MQNCVPSCYGFLGHFIRIAASIMVCEINVCAAMNIDDVIYTAHGGTPVAAHALFGSITNPSPH